MTVNEAGEHFDLIFPNAFPYEIKLNMLSHLDKRVFDDVLSKYADKPVEEFNGYKPGVSDHQELLIAFPNDDIYISYLAAQTDMINGDIARYNNSAGVFNAAFSEFCRMYTRTHRYAVNNKLGDLV
mgnify:CR=1 FL=1